MVDFIDTRKNFPDAQKLSRWQCHHATWVFLTLGLGREGLDQIWALRETENEQRYAFQPNQLGANTFFIIIMI